MKFPSGAGVPLLPKDVSTLSIAEIWAGLSSKERKATNYALKEIKRIPLTDKIARSAGILFYNKKKRGTTTSILDLIIATTAIENNLILISHDKIFRKIKSLKLHTPNKQ